MSDVVELGLRKPATPDRHDEHPAHAAPTANSNSPVKGLVEAFLRIFADCAPDADEKDVKEFAEAIRDFRAQIAACDHDQETRRLGASAVRVCEQFLKRSRHYYATREEELTEMIAILRKTTTYL